MYMLNVCYTLYIYSRYWAESISNNWLHNVSAYIGLCQLHTQVFYEHVDEGYMGETSCNLLLLIDSATYMNVYASQDYSPVNGLSYHFYICCTSLLAVAMRTLDTRLKQEGTPSMAYLRLWQGLSWPTPLWVETPSIVFIISICITYMPCCKSWTMISALRVPWLGSKLVSPSRTQCIRW